MAKAREAAGAAPTSPYKPGNGLEPPYLGDRGAQLGRFREFLGDTSAPHNVVVTGLRGVGKTVLLQRYSVQAREADWLVAEREFSEADAEPSLFAQRVLADLTRLTRDLSVSRGFRDAAGSAIERAPEGVNRRGECWCGIVDRSRAMFRTVLILGLACVEPWFLWLTPSR
jgi:hypothetical protein